MKLVIILIVIILINSELRTSDKKHHLISPNSFIVPEQSIFDLDWARIIKGYGYYGSIRANTIKAKDVIITNKDINILGNRIDSTYYLMPLDKVERYIKENSHLPDIPSAEDVKDGYELGAMNAMLLKKIEEMTLYIIELEKRIEKIEQDR